MLLASRLAMLAMRQRVSPTIRATTGGAMMTTTTLRRLLVGPCSSSSSSPLPAATGARRPMSLRTTLRPAAAAAASSSSSSAAAAASTTATTAAAAPSAKGESSRPAADAAAANAKPAPAINNDNNNNTLSFQEAIVRLQAYWSSKGCALWLPHNSEVGAGTMNPATFLRVLGPEPWRVAYAEPSVRPDDSRYGENPNRLQMHTQYQVILKPDPGNPQELFLGSLVALGIDVRKHDVRFVEDNWENPALGAWGLGWEVWLDGQEVTQFTYFQAVGGAPLDVPAVEITYGLERIVTALQGVSHFTEMRYSPGSDGGGGGNASDSASDSSSAAAAWPGLSYGEMLLQNEYEWSVFNLDAADVPMQRAAFDLHRSEAERLLEARLPLPAYGQILKMSHAFNVLDARGAVSVSDRAASFAAMRGMARKVSALWLARREELGWPLLRGRAKEEALAKAAAEAEAEAGDKKKKKKKKGGDAASAPAAAAAAAAVAPPAGRSLPSSPADFLLEIGCEELPPDDADAAREQLHSRLEQLLAKLGLEGNGEGGGELTVDATPRRVVARVRGLAAATRVSRERLRGPPAKAAFENGGQDRSKPTKALLGFCAKNGVDPSSVEVGPEEGGKGIDYCWASVTSGGEPAAEALERALPALLSQISFGRSMRWESGGPAFSRPVRWVAALHGAAPLAFEALGARSILSDSSSASASTKGIRDGVEAPWLPLPDASSYDQIMASEGVVLSSSEREEAVRSGAEAAARRAGGRLPGGKGGGTGGGNDEGEGEGDAALVDGLVKEVARLVEAPFPLLGSFDPKFLDLPRDVLVTVMRKHQRYFPVEEEEGDGEGRGKAGKKLLPAFVLVANGAKVDPSTVVAGNEAVLRARFEDARFFYAADCAKSLRDFVPELDNVAFHRDLGSLLEKQRRVGELLPSLAAAAATPAFGFSSADLQTAEKAAALARADAATSVVREMTSLAGVMGRHYALRSGEEPEVADAIFEAALPRSSGDALPRSRAGALLAVADRLDSIVGLWSVGGAPTASADPYGLRRAALGLLETAIASGMRLDVSAAARAAAALQPVEVGEEAVSGAVQFIARRLEQLLIDRGLPVEAVRGALGSGRSNDPALAARTAEELAEALLEESKASSSSSSSAPSPLRVAVEALSRPARITRSASAAEMMPPRSLRVDESLFDCDEERALAAALEATRRQLGIGIGGGRDSAAAANVSVGEFLRAVGDHLPGPVAAFFDSVFVMCEDPRVKNNRLALLREVAGLSEGVVKFDELPGF